MEKNELGATPQRSGEAGFIVTDAATARHTPGPWRIEEQSREWFARTNHAYRVVSNNKPTYFVASVEGWGDICKANAHLIAAAPELLEALKAMVASYDGIRDGLTSPVVIAKLRMADAAIAKAEGR